MTYILAAIAIAASIMALATMRRRYLKECDSYDEFLRSLMARSERDNPPVRTQIWGPSIKHGDDQ